MINKRGQGEQFNWIFVIVAGSIILAFFAVFTTKYIQLSELRNNVDIGRNFGKSLNILENSPTGDNGLYIDDNDKVEDGAFKIAVIADMNYTCEDDKAEIKFNNEDMSKQELDRDILFSPSKMKINSLDIWVLPWNFPFFLGNFIFLSDPRADYYIVYSSENEKYINDLTIPSIFNVKKQNIAKFKVETGEVGRFIFFTGKIPFDKIKTNYDKYDVKQVVLNKADSEIGEVIFYDETGVESGKAKFYGKALMWGAIFSDNADTYKCVLNKSLLKVNAVSSIYSSKANLLSKSESSDCSVFYSSIAPELAVYGGKTFTKDGYTKRTVIVTANKKLRENGCASVF